MMGRVSMSALLWYYASASVLWYFWGLGLGWIGEGDGGTGMALGLIGGVSTMNQTKIVVEV